VSAPKHTQFAMKALDMAEMFRIRVGTVPVQASVPYRVELGTPDGPSTGGGKQALQAIKLIPEGAGATLVAGHANKAGGKAELRTFDCLAQQHAQRFKGAALPIPKESYDALFVRLEKFFAEQGLAVERLEADAVQVPQASASISPPAEPVLWPYVAGFLALLAGGGLWTLLR